MSVNIIENWSDIVGRVVEQISTTQESGFKAWEVIVEEVHEVKGFTNLMEETRGSTILLLFPQEIDEGLSLVEGSLIRCRVRQADLKKYFVHRDFVELQNQED